MPINTVSELHDSSAYSYFSRFKKSTNALMRSISACVSMGRRSVQSKVSGMDRCVTGSTTLVLGIDRTPLLDWHQEWNQNLSVDEVLVPLYSY